MLAGHCSLRGSANDTPKDKRLLLSLLEMLSTLL